MPDDDPVERRRADRIELLGALQGEVMLSQHTAIRSLGRDGMQVETAFPLQVDSLHDFRVSLGNHSVVVKGRVAYARISDVDQDIVRYEVGVEFVAPPDHVTAALEAFVDHVQRQRRGGP